MGIKIIKDNNFCGIESNKLFHKVNNNFVRECSNVHYFKATSEGQFDYMVYIALLSKINAYKECEISLNRLVESIGYKPKTGKGKINDRVRESLKRLEEDYKLIIPAKESTDKYLMLEVIVLEVEERFFKLNLNNIRKILNNSVFKLNTADFSNKYTDRAKALYVYSYLLSMFGVHETTSIGVKFNGCYPNMDKICKDCNVTKEYLLKVLAYFEYDGLIYVANVGAIEEFDGGTYKSCNYYTDSLINLFGAYAYAIGYLDQYQYSYNSNYKQSKALLVEINELFNQTYDKLTDKEIICFKENYKMMFENTVNEANKLYKDVSISNFEKFIVNREYLNLRLYKTNKDSKKTMLYLASIENMNVMLLTHFRNKLKALMYMYNVR